MKPVVMIENTTIGNNMLHFASTTTQHGFPNPFEVNATIQVSSACGSRKNSTAQLAPVLANITKISNVDDGIDSENGSEKTQELHPCDRGKHAWFYLFGTAMIEGLMWGFPLTYGVFQTYYQTHPPFEDNPNLAMVGTLTTGISYIGTLLVTPITIRYPKYQRHMIVIGCFVCILSLLAGSFATQLWHLILTQGVGYGVGFLIAYYPILSMLNEWFVERRGFAYGVLFAAASAFGLGLPFLVEFSLHRYGYAITLRAVAVSILILIGPVLPLLKPRLPPDTTSAKSTAFDWKVLRRISFTAASLSNSFQGLVYFLPGIFLPTYAASLGLSTSRGSLILALSNLSQVFGQLATGFLADHYTFYMPMTLSTLLSALVVLLLWGFASSLSSLIAFGIVYGFVAGGYSVLYCRFVTALSDERATGLWLYSIFERQRGAGNILGGYVAGLLVNDRPSDGEYGLSRYKWAIVFVGCSMVAASLGGLGWLFNATEWTIESGEKSSAPAEVSPE